MNDWNTARKKEAEAAAAKAAAGKGGRKAATSKDKNKKKLKRVPKTPVAEVWFWLLGALDELLHKAKRITLEDLYRGAEQLGQTELVQLRNILATANKKVLPPEMNLNQMTAKQALWSAAAAHEYRSVDRSLLAPVPGLAPMRDKGLSSRQLHELGFREGELLRAGFSVSEICDLSRHDPARLRAAGLSVSDLVAGFGGPARLPPDLQGFRGILKLRAAGYSAAEMVAGGLDNAWDLRRAGFTASDVFSAGVPAEALRPAGFGLPELRPPSFLGPSVAVLQESDPRLLPAPLEGTRGGIWPKLLQAQAPAHPGKHDREQSRHASGASATARMGLGATLRNRPATAASALSVSVAGTSNAASFSTTMAASGAPDLPHRTVAWPDTPSGGGSAGPISSVAGGLLPPAPVMSRMGSLNASVRSGG
ncbi:hypothetical protein GPECTOR_10g1091 [Gonium pectorale]|uniref:Uncharacterized protein n=1 Tax=Gonium pectorale TaxID=33097 RepID=A0A150GQQ6_GONPE|nr:hypothetical protein GPECTOR_10g1091 [Gonium pectorale]|eukprot:KXZ52068.1 hypothetical protein GPECTOR_10g1091 [Gonium pectorale]